MKIGHSATEQNAIPYGKDNITEYTQKHVMNDIPMMMIVQLVKLDLYVILRYLLSQLAGYLIAQTYLNGCCVVNVSYFYHCCELTDGQASFY